MTYDDDDVSHNIYREANIISTYSVLFFDVFDNNNSILLSSRVNYNNN